MTAIKDQDITETVRKLLGDHVEYAYSTKQFYEDISEWNDIDSIRCICEDGSISPEDARPIVIKMKDMKPVILWTSEWGGLLPFDDENDIPSSG
jgi:hypothetical protein